MEMNATPWMMLQQFLMAPVFALPRMSRDLKELSECSDEPDKSLCLCAMKRMEDLSDKIEHDIKSKKRADQLKAPTDLF